ncbi:MAG: GrpB family protein [Dehalococcoidia bacterium]
MTATRNPSDRQRAHGRGVVLVPSDPLWPERYEEAAALIRQACGALLVELEHVGSTSIPGIAAKPYLDLMPGVATHEDGFRLIPPMESIGYQSRGDLGIPGRHYFTKIIEGDDHVWKHNVHAYATDHIEWARHLVFRDALRASDTLRDEYEALKRRLAAQFPDDVDSYAEAKSELVERIIAAHGGPPRPSDFPPPPPRG